jgi:hypothetical protein
LLVVVQAVGKVILRVLAVAAVQVDYLLVRLP